jgi:hypothetical protein
MAVIQCAGRKRKEATGSHNIGKAIVFVGDPTWASAQTTCVYLLTPSARCRLVKVAFV